MLTENDVIKSVVSHLEANDWRIVDVRWTHQRGIDILAKRHGNTLAIEAKGGTASTPGSARYGQPFTANQKKSHVSRALYTAACEVSKKEHQAGIAVPSDPKHEQLMKAILPVLEQLKIEAFLVEDDGHVRKL